MFTNRKALITLVLFVVAAAYAATPMAGEHSSAEKFAGTFYYEGGTTTMINADGTSSTINARMFTDDPDESSGGRKMTPRQGVWRQVNEDTIRITQVSFLTGEFSHDYVPNGLIQKISWTLEFEDEVNGVFQVYTAKSILIGIYVQGQNPAIDEPVVAVPLEDAGLKGYRLHAELSAEDQAKEDIYQSLKSFFD